MFKKFLESCKAIDFVFVAIKHVTVLLGSIYSTLYTEVGPGIFSISLLNLNSQ